MKNNHKQSNTNGVFLLAILLLNVIILKSAYIYNHNWYWGLLVTAPLLVFAGNVVKRERSNGEL